MLPNVAAPRNLLRKKEDKDPNKELSARQKKFCFYYVYQAKTAVEAYAEAGYKIKNGNCARSASNQLLQEPKIKKFVADELHKIRLETKVTFQWKEDKLRECIEACMQTDNKGRLFDAKAAISAISELNKMHGDHAAEKRVNINFNDPDLNKVRELTVQYEREY
jgi:phage terminase small subunit